MNLKCDIPLIQWGDRSTGEPLLFAKISEIVQSEQKEWRDVPLFSNYIGQEYDVHILWD